MFGLSAFSEVSRSGTPILFSSANTTGVSASGSINSFASKSTSPSLTALTGTGSVGTMGALVSAPESGQVATGNLGVLTPQITLTPTGKTGTGSVGSLIFTYSANLTGRTATAIPGSLSPQSSPTLSGVTGTGSVGSFDHVFFWTQVNDTQSVTWTRVDNS